ncbi:MAG: hypothetical protein M3Q75_05045, partial [Gemmatimonadota bacterium]|nr:hypothetical protein [Gemmatimonadota bacterium]
CHPYCQAAGQPVPHPTAGEPLTTRSGSDTGRTRQADFARQWFWAPDIDLTTGRRTSPFRVDSFR